MDEIIQILIFVGAMVIMVVQQNVTAKKKPKTSPFPTGEILEEVFPEVEQAESISKPAIKTAPKKKKNYSSPASSRPASVTSSSPQKKEKIRLNSREEAKRAFIYSEIFNRKY